MTRRSLNPKKKVKNRKCLKQTVKKLEISLKTKKLGQAPKKLFFNPEK